MQQMYSSSRKLLWIELKQFSISLYFVFFSSHQSQNFIAYHVLYLRFNLKLGFIC
jgi:hypothetical protein